MYKLPGLFNQKGAIPLPLLIAALAVVAFLVFAFVGPYKDRIFTSLYQKPSSSAAEKQLKFEEDSILMKFKEGTSESEEEEILKQNEGTKKDEIKQIKTKLIKVPQGKVLEKIEKLKNNPKVEFAEVNGLGSPEFIPNDPDYSKQWHLARVNASTAWDSAQGTGITIAIADTGVESSHPDLAGNIVPGWNVYNNNADTSDIYGHGTGVAGAAAAVINNGTKVSGIAGKAKIMPIQIAYKDGSGNAWASWYDMAEAIVYAADHGAKIVNISFQNSSGNSTVRNAADYMMTKGGLTVFCESNTSANSGFSSYPSIISVSATGSTDALASFSTFGNDVDVSAPGQGILTTSMGGGTTSMSGTSFSAPLAAGVLALIWQLNPGLTPTAAADILNKSADDLGAPGWDIYYGWGRINAMKAVALAKGEPLPTPLPSIVPTTIPSPTVVPTSSPFDPIPPTVSISSPVNGGTVSRNATITINAFASDNLAVSRVEFYVDNSLKCTDTTAAYSCSTKIGGKPGASHSIMVKAYDINNNSTSSSSNVTTN